MKDNDPDLSPITPELLLRAYAAGVFPMAESADAPEIFWIEPKLRGIIPLDGFHVSRSLRKRLLRQDYTVTIDRAFGEVVAACANRDETWINPEIQRLYDALHQRAQAHSVEVWSEGGLAGGVYGVRLGAAFFGESMFSRIRDGSKIALAFLIARLRAGGFALFDTQFTTPHLERLGAISIPKERYSALLREAIRREARFQLLPEDASAERVLQEISQTS